MAEKIFIRVIDLTFYEETRIVNEEVRRWRGMKAILVVNWEGVGLGLVMGSARTGRRGWLGATPKALPWADEWLRLWRERHGCRSPPIPAIRLMGGCAFDARRGGRFSQRQERASVNNPAQSGEQAGDNGGDACELLPTIYTRH